MANIGSCMICAVAHLLQTRGSLSDNSLRSSHPTRRLMAALYLLALTQALALAMPSASNAQFFSRLFGMLFFPAATALVMRRFYFHRTLSVRALTLLVLPPALLLLSLSTLAVRPQELSTTWTRGLNLTGAALSLCTCAYIVRLTVTLWRHWRRLPLHCLFEGSSFPALIFLRAQVWTAVVVVACVAIPLLLPWPETLVVRDGMMALANIHLLVNTRPQQTDIISFSTDNRKSASAPSLQSMLEDPSALKAGPTTSMREPLISRTKNTAGQ